MRNSLGRLTLRGARAVAASGNSRAATVANRAKFASRDLCTSSAVSTDAKRKSETDPESKDPERLVVLPEEAPQLSVQVLTADADIPAVESPLATQGVQTVAETLGADVQEVDAGIGAPLEPAVRSPSEMLNYMKELLNRNANRSALYHYGAAFKVDGVPSVDEEVMKLMLPVLGRNGWARTATDTINLAIERGYSLGIGSINCGMHAMARTGMAPEVTTMLNKMWAMPGESNPNATSYNYLIQAHIYRGNVDQAFEVLNDMKEHLIYPTFATYHALITGCLRRRDPRRAYQTLIAVEKQRFDISAMTVAQVLVASANNDDYDHVSHLLAKFEECLPRYGSELHRIAEFRGLYRLQDAQRTSKADRDTLRGEPKPEIGAISAVLHCAFRGGRVDLASRSWVLMEEFYPDFDVPLPLWYCLVGAYAGAGDFAQAIDIVGAMREKGLRPSMRDLEMSLIRPLAYDVNVIDEQYYRLCDRKDGKEPEKQHSASGEVAAESESNSDDSVKVIDEVSTSEADQDPAAKDLTEADQDPAAKDLTEADQDPAAKDLTETDQDPAAKDLTESVDTPPEDAEQAEAHETEEEVASSTKPSSSLAEALFSSDVSLSAASIGERFRPKTVGIDELNCIIGACSASQDLDRAFQTFDEVETRFGLERNIDTYNALLEGCVQTRRLAGGMRVLEEIEGVGLSISGPTLHLAARLMLRAGRTADVSKLLKKAHSQGDSVLLQTYQMVLRHFVRGDNFDGALDLLKQGEEEAGFEFRALTGRFDVNSMTRLRDVIGGGHDVADERREGEHHQGREVFEDDGLVADEAGVEEAKEDKQ